MMLTIQDQVRQFHDVFGIRDPRVPTVPSDDVVRLRLRLIAEEFFELLGACVSDEDDEAIEDIEDAWHNVRHIIDSVEPSVDLPAVADALADTAYVIEGAFQVLGIDSAAVLAEVQRSNMSKIGSENRADGKITKGPHYSPPDIAAVLRRLGWQP